MAGHRASQNLHSLPPCDDSPLPLGVQLLGRFHNRTSTASLDTINTLLPQYSVLDQETDTVALWGDDLGAHRELTHSQADDSDTGTLAGGVSHSENSNPSHRRRGFAHRTHIQHLQWVEEQAMGYVTCIQPTSARCFTKTPEVPPLLKWRYNCGFD